MMNKMVVRMNLVPRKLLNQLPKERIPKEKMPRAFNPIMRRIKLTKSEQRVHPSSIIVHINGYKICFEDSPTFAKLWKEMNDAVTPTRMVKEGQQRRSVRLTADQAAPMSTTPSCQAVVEEGQSLGAPSARESYPQPPKSTRSSRQI